MTIRILALGVVFLATACSGGADPTLDAGSCSDVVEIKGDQWTSIPLKEPLARDSTIGPEVVATQHPCDDFDYEGAETPDDGESETVAVPLLRIVGVPTDEALFDPTKEGFVYVNARDDQLEKLSQSVRDLLRVP